MVSAQLHFGDIVLAADGTYASKPRPVLVFQNSNFPTGESIIVIPFTSENNAAAHYCVAVSPSPANGLDRQCWLEVEKVSAIRAAWTGPRVGTLDIKVLEQASALAHQLMSAEAEQTHTI